VWGEWSDTGEAERNEVEIAGSPTSSSTNTIIYGGSSDNGRESKRVNILKIRAKVIEVLGIKNFEEYKFLQ
jgi:hypothetical protein